MTTPDAAEQTPPAPVRTEVPIAAAVSALLFLTFLIVPMAGLLTLPLASVPIVRLSHRRGVVAALLGAGLMVGVLWALGLAMEGSADAFRLALMGGIVVLLPGLFAASVRAGRDPSTAYLGLCVVGFLIFSAALGIGPGGGFEETARAIDRTFDSVLAAPTSAARPELQATFAAAREFTKRYWIGLVGVGWILGAAISFYTGAWASRPAASAERTRFEAFRIPAVVAPIFVATGAVFGLGREGVAQVAGNVLWPLAALYFVGGLSIICHFARRWFRPRLLRIGLYALVVYVPVNVGVALLGLFDWYMDFRRRGEGATKTS